MADMRAAGIKRPSDVLEWILQTVGQHALIAAEDVAALRGEYSNKLEGPTRVITFHYWPHGEEATLFSIV